MLVSGARVVITGGAGGIGSATVLDLAGRGAVILAVDTDGPALDRLRATTREAGLKVICRQCDVSSEAEVENLFDWCDREWGGCEVLINNAGLAGHGSLIRRSGSGWRKLPLENWNKVLATDLTGVFLCAREAAPLMADRGRGVIVNISSVWRAGQEHQSAYAAAKAAVAALTVTWARELATEGIRVAAVAPGYIQTPMTEAIPADRRSAIIRQRIPLGRFGQPDEVAGAIRFVIENDYLTGRVLDLDGGAWE